MANRTTRTATNRRAILKTVAEGYSITRAARMVGLSRSVIYEWKAADITFAADLEAAYEEGTDALHDAALDRALLPDHDGLLVFLLKMRDPARFYRKAVEVIHTVAGDPVNPITVEHHAVLNGDDDANEVVHFYLPDNGRDQPERDDPDEVITETEKAGEDVA
jgi:hypothetical protein